MKWLLLILLFSYGLRAQEPFDIQAYSKFLYKMDLFNRKLTGCPLEPDVIHKEDCRPARGVFDAKLWKELRKDAFRVFLLARPKEDVIQRGSADHQQ